jgi:hypothetical protein
MKKIPFEFVLETLARANPRIKPMFGCQAIYIEEKIVLILRKRKDYEDDNGVWVATAKEHHASLKKDLPSLRSIRLLGRVTAWQNLPCQADDFEESVMKACEFILKGDVRIGKVPKTRSKKKT